MSKKIKKGKNEKWYILRTSREGCECPFECVDYRVEEPGARERAKALTRNTGVTHVAAKAMFKYEPDALEIPLS